MANPATARLPLESFDPSITAELRTLHKRNSHWNWVCLLYPSLWLVSALLMAEYPYWWVRVAGIVVIGVSIQAMAILMHEALHGNLFRNQILDRWTAFAFGIPAFFSGTAYRVAHLNHHRNTRTAKDQDEISYLVDTPAQYRLLFYAWFVIGTLFYFLIVPWKALRIASPVLRRRILSEYAAMFAIYAFVIGLALSSDRGGGLFLYWLIPAQLAMVLSNIRGLAEHLGTGFGNALTRTRTTTSNALVSFVMCNLNYHVEHHLFPGVPWYNLKKVHRLLAPLYARSGVHIERSYLVGVLRALRFGPFDEFHGGPVSLKGSR